MNKKIPIGLVGMLVGGFWFMDRWSDFDQQGIVAIGIPAVIFLLGLNYFIKGVRGER